MAADSIGMMDAGYFVGRNEIMAWVNENLMLNLSRIEQTANGAIACQLLDIIFPGQVPMHKLNWAARADHEFVGNYKVLQACFDRLGIDRYVEVDKLIRAKYQDNLEFMQWFKRFFEMHTPASDYDAVAARARGKGGTQYTQQYGSGIAASRAPSRRTGQPLAAKPRPVSEERTENRGNVGAKAVVKPTTARVASSNSDDKDAKIAELQSESDELRSQLAETGLTCEGLTRERDFYFEKLKDIEVLIQAFTPEDDASDLTQHITDILYATTDGFEAVPEEAGVDPEYTDVYTGDGQGETF